VIIGYIINTLLLFLFDVSSSSGIIYCCVFIFDKVYLFMVDKTKQKRRCVVGR